MAAYVLTDRAVIEALRECAARGVKVRMWRDASEAERLSDFDVEAQLGGTDAPERLLRRSSLVAHRLGQLQSVRRDAPGQRPSGAERRGCLRGV
jgi:hypothetical protein